MRPEDFFIEQVHQNPFAPSGSGLFGQVNSSDPFALPAGPTFDLELVARIRSGQTTEIDDLEAASALTTLVHDELEEYGTSGQEQLSNSEMRECLMALRSVLHRLGVTDVTVPFRDFKTFRTYWLRNDAHGSWQARREILQSIFNPIHDELADREAQVLSGGLADPVSPRGRTGWTRIDQEIAEIRRHFASAKTPQDYRNVGNDCVIVLEGLSAQAYEPNRHLREGEEEPPVGQTKNRLNRVVEINLPGPANAELRKQIKATIELAQAVKHRNDGDRLTAGIAADSVILLANILRRISAD